MKADQRSSDNVKKWSNECDATIKLWGRQTVDLMSKMLHLIVIQSDALTIKCNVRHAAPNFIAIRWEAVNARIAAFDRDKIRCTLTIVWKNCQNCIWCRCHQMHWRLSRWRGLNVADYASKCDVRWLHPMLMH